MNTKTRRMLLFAGALILLGCLILCGVMMMLKWDFSKLSTKKFETNRYEIEEAFADIAVLSDTASVIFLPAEDGKCVIECFEERNAKHAVTVENGALAITLEDTRKWFEYIGIGFTSPKITVYLPLGEYETLSVKLSTGDVSLPDAFSFTKTDISASTGDVSLGASALGEAGIKTTTGRITVEGASGTSLSLSVSTGKVFLTDTALSGDLTISVSTGKAFLTRVTAKNLQSTGDTGDITLEGVLIAERLFIERDTGDVLLTASDAAELEIVTDTGDVTGSLLSEKIFIPRSDTGRIFVPETTSGGKCTVKTDTGDIRFTLIKAN